MPAVDLYFDFRSPFAYFTAHRIRSEQVAPGVSIDWRWHPVSIDVLLNLQANKSDWATYSDPLAPPKRKHFLKDVVRSAEYCRVPIRPPNPPRSNSIPALCASLALAKAGTEHDRFRNALFDALWQQQRDIGDRAVLYACASAANVPTAIIDAAFAPDAKELLATATRAAYENDIFGVPSFVSGGEIYFGNDRLDMLVSRIGRASAT